MPLPQSVGASFLTLHLAWRCCVDGRRRVDCLFNLRALPLQALSLLVVPLPWTVPRLLAVQLSVQAAILEGACGGPA